MKKFILILLGVSFLWRLLFLQIGIDSLTHDEIDFYYSGYKLAHTGNDAHGNRLFLTSGYISATPSIPIYISALGWKILPEKTPFNARLPFAVLNSITPVLLFLITLKLTGNKRLALWSYVALCFSPWFSHISTHVPYDAPLSLLFGLAALYSFLSIPRIRIGAPIACIFAFLAFNSYMGFKTVFPFVVFIAIWLRLQKTNMKGVTILFISALSACLIFMMFLVMLAILPESYLVFSRGSAELLTPFSTGIKDYLWYAHWTTPGFPAINKLIYNKLTAWIVIVASKWIQSFDMRLMFVTGEPSGVYGLRIMGLFYLTDFIFFLYALLHINRIPPLLRKFILYSLLIGGIPFALHISDITVSLRGLWLVIPYSLLIAYGMNEITRRKYYWLTVVCLLVLFNISSFSYIYGTRIKTISSENYYSTDKAIAEMLLNRKGKYIVISKDPYGILMQYAFYQKNENIYAMSQLLQEKEKQEYVLDNLIFSEHCSAVIRENDFVLIEGQYCPKYQPLNRKKEVIISMNKDNKVMYELYLPGNSYHVD